MIPDEYWVIEDSEKMGGPYDTLEEAQREADGWTRGYNDVRVARTIARRKTVITYEHNWDL